MKSAIRNLPGVLDTHSVALPDRSYVLALGLARAMAYRFPLPTSPVDIPLSYFTLQYQEVMSSFLSEVNEQMVLNIDLTVLLTKRLWMMRYDVLYDSDNVIIRDLLDKAVTSGSRQVPPNASEMYRRYESGGLFKQMSDAAHEALEGVM